MKELIKQYRDQIWREAYCHPFSNSDESDLTIDKIENLTKELEEKAEAFDWFALHGAEYLMDYCSNLGWKLQHLVYTDQVFEGQTFIECVRKARGDV